MLPLVLLLWTTNITFLFVGHLISIFMGILKSTNSSILEHVHHCQTTKLCAHKIMISQHLLHLSLPSNESNLVYWWTQTSTDTRASHTSRIMCFSSSSERKAGLCKASVKDVDEPGLYNDTMFIWNNFDFNTEKGTYINIMSFHFYTFSYDLQMIQLQVHPRNLLFSTTKMCMSLTLITT